MPATPITLGTTQHVCTGWTGTGSVPASGSTTNTDVFSIMQDSSIEWRWTNRYQLTLGTIGNGTLNHASAWHTSGTNVSITATPGSGATFAAWSGDTNGCVITDQQISVPMTSARSINAVFSTPGEPFWFRAAALDNSIMLRWPNPLSLGYPFADVLIRSNTNAYPATTSEGTEVYEGPGQSFLHEIGITPGVTYYYTLWVSADGNSTWIEPE